MSDIVYKPVRSSTVACVGHDGDRTLGVIFHHRDPSVRPTYHFRGVSVELHQQLLRESERVERGVPGASVGVFFHTKIRDRFPTTRVDAGAPATRPGYAAEDLIRAAEFAYQFGLRQESWGAALLQLKKLMGMGGSGQEADAGPDRQTPTTAREVPVREGEPAPPTDVVSRYDELAEMMREETPRRG